MRREQIFTSWLVTCHSPQESDRLQEKLMGQIDLDRVVIDTRLNWPNGIEHIERVPHRLGDYFGAIRMLPTSTPNDSSFRLVFQRSPTAGRYWKDLMVNVLREANAAPERQSITIDYKGDETPAGMIADHESERVKPLTLER